MRDFIGGREKGEILKYFLFDWMMRVRDFNEEKV